jgi:hypothetical protein
MRNPRLVLAYFSATTATDPANVHCVEIEP